MKNIKRFNIFLESNWMEFLDDYHITCEDDLLYDINQAENGIEEENLGVLDLIINEIFESENVDPNVIKTDIEGTYVAYLLKDSTLELFVDNVLFDDKTPFRVTNYNNDIHRFKYKYLTFIVVENGVEICDTYYGHWAFTSKDTHEAFKLLDNTIIELLNDNLEFWTMLFGNSKEEFISNIKTIKNAIL
jgi:hypothetical protein